MVLAEDNPAARRLRRPGEAIYNSAHGLVEGNSQFQVAYFSDADRERYLQELVAVAGRLDKPHRVILYKDYCCPCAESVPNRVGAAVFAAIR